MKIRITLILYLIIFQMNYSFAQKEGELPVKIIKSENLNINNSDSLLIEYNRIKNSYLKKLDTLKAIPYIVESAKIYSTTGNYSKSYDSYWEALIYSNKIKDSTHLDRIYTGLGVLYSMFERDVDAEKYLNLSLNIQKKHKITTIDQYGRFSNTYHMLSSHNRENGHYVMAQKYLDSCNIIHQKYFPQLYMPVLTTEQGYIYSLQGKLNEALTILLPLEDYLIKNRPSYLVIFYSFLGDIYFKKKDFISSETYYLKSLKYSDNYKSHQNYIPNVYQKLGNVYVQMNKMNLAYQHLQKSKELAEHFFGFRSKNNSNLLEIKDTYRHELETQRIALEAVKIKELKQEQQNLFLRNLLLTISFISLLIISGIIVWILVNRRKSEKVNFINKQKLSNEKNAEIIQFKNKELTTSALQLIQKDELLLTIKDKVSQLKDINNNDINTVLTKIKINKNQDWKEFNARFTSVNQAFYRTLATKYPELTRRDHKLCALIKLNFTSKEIAQLLGISMESVNTARYRLRKKMELNNDENLSEFIARIM